MSLFEQHGDGREVEIERIGICVVVFVLRLIRKEIIFFEKIQVSLLDTSLRKKEKVLQKFWTLSLYNVSGRGRYFFFKKSPPFFTS